MPHEDLRDRLKAIPEAVSERAHRDAEAEFRQAKIKLMMAPLDLPVTRLMNTKQSTQYLDDIYQHFTSEGVALTQPEDQRYADMGVPK